MNAMDNESTSQWITASPDQTRTLAAALARHAQAGDVVVLDGDLGAGKTRFAQGLARGLGIHEDVVSPTFNILQVYPSGRLPLYHFDLYRLEDADQLEDIDFFATVEGDGLSCIEWGGQFAESLPDERLEVTIEETGADARRITARALGVRGGALLGAWAASPEAAALAGNAPTC